MNDEDTQVIYQIVIKGVLDASWGDWLGNMDVCVKYDGSTILTGSIPDQAALRGILNAIWDMNLEIISVKRMVENLD